MAQQNAVMAWLTGPTGPKTVHFWGPMANWGLVAAAVNDFNKPVDQVSPTMTGVLMVYSGLFMRFAWMVQPRNYLLLACHASNELCQSYQMSRIISAGKKSEPTLIPTEEPSALK